MQSGKNTLKQSKVIVWFESEVDGCAQEDLHEGFLSNLLIVENDVKE